ncbi:MAG TPA: SPOR domain-containing protein [Desulfuromonadales bacterium]|nr:SPOR domain-containing protein [Desulfuromonadales bacterium]
MVRQFATRSQRRLEKKQAVILLALVLVVSMVSFTLGVLVGRGSAKPVVAVAPPQAVRMPVAEAVPPPAAAAPAAGERPADSLTFYDSLPKGGQAPLGSGINLRPASETAPLATVPAAEPAKPAAVSSATAVATSMPTKADVPAPSPAKATAPVAKAAAPAAKPTAPVAKPTAPVAKATAPAAAGGYLVQAAAFRRSEDARGLQAKLARKGYSVFTEEANLGAKGVWYRVYVGPFATAGAADSVVSRLKTEERLTALVRKR